MTTKPKLRIGLIGTGFMGKAHVFGFTSAPRVFELTYDLDLHTVADGTEHTLHTQFVMDWDGTITNAVDGDTRPRVQVHISKSRVVRYSDRQKGVYYLSQVDVSAGGQSIWSSDYYGFRDFVQNTEKVSFTRFPELDRPPPVSYVDPS